MASPRYWSFRTLADELAHASEETFSHRWQDPSLAAQLPTQFRPENWDYPGRSGEEQVPKYLYRGEAGTFSSSLPSRARVKASFDQAELELLDELTDMASWCWRLRFGDPFRSIGWPQHYGFPTPVLDLTSDPLVALHFAADAREAASTEPRVVYRLDLEAILPNVYGPAGQPAPLAAASIAHEFCNRAARQRAWVICSHDVEAPLDFQRCEHLAEHVERFTVDGRDAATFVHPELLDASSDFFACWPLAVLRSFKASIERPLPRRVAEWIVGRLPLFEQTPVRIFYDGRGRGSRWELVSPAEASAADGRCYAAQADAVVAELTGPDLPTPSGLLFGVPTGGQPHSDRWLRAGDECEVQWRYPFPGPPRYNGRAFERVTIR
jgi:hypothetical protein